MRHETIGEWLYEIERRTPEKAMLVVTGCRHEHEPSCGECDSCVCETEFSWRECDSCGSELGGSRHALAYVFTGSRRASPEYLASCVDCLMLVANGELPAHLCMVGYAGYTVWDCNCRECERIQRDTKRKRGG